MFADSYYPVVDGAVIAMQNQIRGLEARGHEIVVLAPGPPSNDGVNKRVHYLPSIRFRSYEGYRVVVSPSDMLEFLRDEKPDYLHCHGLSSMAILSLTAARVMTIPHVLTFHTMANEAVKYYSPIPFREDFIVPMTWIYLRNLLRRPELVIAPTNPIKAELVENQVRMNACEVIPTGVDLSKFHPDNYDRAFLPKYGLEGKRVALHVGRLSKEKRLDIVLKAMAELRATEPDLRLLVAGTGPAENEYKQLAESLHISDRVVWAGFVPDEDLPKVYASCDILVISSTFETQGLVVLEAMASGIPVAGMRARAIPEFVMEGKNGCLFDLSTCADGIRRCLSRADSMKLNCVASAREYSIEACSARLEKAYGVALDVLERTHGHRPG